MREASSALLGPMAISPLQNAPGLVDQQQEGPVEAQPLARGHADQHRLAGSGPGRGGPRRGPRSPGSAARAWPGGRPAVRPRARAGGGPPGAAGSGAGRPPRSASSWTSTGIRSPTWVPHLELDAGLLAPTALVRSAQVHSSIRRHQMSARGSPTRSLRSHAQQPAGAVAGHDDDPVGSITSMGDSGAARRPAGGEIRPAPIEESFGDPRHSPSDHASATAGRRTAR